ncbi:retrovirus-related Pol polyprotein from transposon 297 [Nephila pilipes]|uniref:Retrovirus-related Pol polyprotein from transposon 297 n=1 Tax=Nephila pilipes TaxID=299642 RepID=A0A8X6TLJ2_NEPPI|nr:retrovirus-related Pol polyprotein from transposon 297 [Nephila pilipes]
MKTLNNINEINTALRNCRVEKINLFLILTETESNEFKNKLQNLNDSFSLNELVTICNILNIPFAGTKQEVASRILLLLCDLEDCLKTARKFLQTQTEEDQNPPHNSEEKKNKSDSSMQCESRDDF